MGRGDSVWIMLLFAIRKNPLVIFLIKKEISSGASELDLSTSHRSPSQATSENGVNQGDYVLMSKPPRRPISRSNSKVHIAHSI